jgi:hypothetical protein
MSPSAKGAAAIFAAAIKVRTRVTASLASPGVCGLRNMLFMVFFSY